jgi:hypothetical protein
MLFFMPVIKETSMTFINKVFGSYHKLWTNHAKLKESFTAHRTVFGKYVLCLHLYA